MALREAYNLHFPSDSNTVKLNQMVKNILKKEPLKAKECGSTVSNKKKNTEMNPSGPLYVLPGSLVSARLCHDSPALPPTKKADSRLPGYCW